MRKKYSYFYLLILWLSLSTLIGCTKDKTIRDVVNEGRTSYMSGTWDITFTKYLAENFNNPIKCIKMTVIISNETDVHNIKDIDEVVLITYDKNNKEQKETILFEDLLSKLDDFDREFYIKHDIKKLERKSPNIKYSLKGSRFAKRDNKNNEYDEIIAKQTLIQKNKAKKEKESTTILFEMEKRIRTKQKE
ncbi:MAG: hypothetical protein IKX70_06155 [Treponema sp.]|nr:hypothetical protein [Treponema sp.]